MTPEEKLREAKLLTALEDYAGALPAEHCMNAMPVDEALEFADNANPSELSFNVYEYGALRTLAAEVRRLRDERGAVDLDETLLHLANAKAKLARVEALVNSWAGRVKDASSAISTGERLSSEYLAGVNEIEACHDELVYALR